MFFFFFNGLYDIAAIQQAFKSVCLDKLLIDGYFDMSIYINARINKDDIHTKLKKEKSPYAALYQKAYPKPDNAYRFWLETFPNDNCINYMDNDENGCLSDIEAIAIVNWIYKMFKKAEERVAFTKELFGHIKELYDIRAQNQRFCPHDFTASIGYRYAQGVQGNRKLKVGVSLSQERRYSKAPHLGKVGIGTDTEKGTVQARAVSRPAPYLCNFLSGKRNGF